MYTNQPMGMCGPGYELYSIAESIRSCAARLDGLTEQIRSVRAIDWQSPAGEGFRQCMYEHLINVGKLHESTVAAATATVRMAELAAAEELSRPAGASG